MVSALNAYKSLFDSGAVHNSVLSLTGSDPDTLFYSGKAAFLIGGSWEASVLSAPYRSANKIAHGDWGAAAVPVATAGGKAAVRKPGRGWHGHPEVVATTSTLQRSSSRT